MRTVGRLGSLAVLVGACSHHAGVEQTEPDASTLPPDAASHAQLESAVPIVATDGYSIQIPPTSAGDQIYAIFTGPPADAWQIEITAGGTPIVIEEGGDMPSPCGGWIGTWHAVDVPSGITEVTLRGSTFTGYLMVFSGLDGPFYDRNDIAEGSGNTPLASAPSLPAEAGNAVVSFVGTCSGAINELVQGTGFTALPSVGAIDAAYVIATRTGSYGAKWNIAGEDYSSLTRVLW